MSDPSPAVAEILAGRPNVVTTWEGEWVTDPHELLDYADRLEALVREQDATLQHAGDMCARPAGVCLLAAAVVTLSTDTPEEAPNG